MILLIGFPKSGTSSFQKLFEDLGYNSIHWKYKSKKIGSIIKENKDHKRPLLSGFEEVDCITQMDICTSTTSCYWPQLVDFKQLYEENKDAIFILNKRKSRHILSSFKRWKKMDERLYKYNPELIKNKTDKGFIKFVKSHYKNVERFFKSIPDAKFLTYDINKDKIDKLKNSLILKIYKFSQNAMLILKTLLRKIIKRKRKKNKTQIILIYVFLIVFFSSFFFWSFFFMLMFSGFFPFPF